MRIRPFEYIQYKYEVYSIYLIYSNQIGVLFDLFKLIYWSIRSIQIEYMQIGVLFDLFESNWGLFDLFDLFESNIFDLFESNICESGFYSIYSIRSIRFDLFDIFESNICELRLYLHICEYGPYLHICEYMRIYICKNWMIYAILCKFSHKKCINLHIFA